MFCKHLYNIDDMRKLDITEYNLGHTFGLDIAVIADLHGEPFEGILKAFNDRRPDIICIPGDLSRIVSTEEHDGKYLYQDYNVITFLCYAISVAPVYYSRGNSECRWNLSDFAELIRMGVHIMENSWEEFCPGLAIGGLSSAQSAENHTHSVPKTEWLSQFDQYNGYKILLSHHPEYYKPYIQDHTMDLVISGHAHGGQIRFGNQGLYAPGQGVFPKLTSGMYDQRLIISRGISRKPWYAPSFGNPPELIYITL